MSFTLSQKLTTVPFKVIFGERTDIPIVQVSLFGEEETEHAGKLGKALSAVRDEGYWLVCIGQLLTRPDTMQIDDFESIDYTKAAVAAATSEDPYKATLAMQKHPIFNRIPYERDYQPLVVATAAVRPDDKVELIARGSDGRNGDYRDYETGYEGPMGWAIIEWK